MPELIQYMFITIQILAKFIKNHCLPYFQQLTTAMNFKILRRLLFYVVLFINFVLLESCEFQRELDYYKKYDVPLLVTHGYISPQYGVQVVVKKATSPSEVNANDAITNVHVLLHKNDTEYIQLEQVSCYLFESDSVAYIENDQTYYIRVVSDDFGEIYSSRQTVLPTPKIDSVRFAAKSREMINVYFKNNYTQEESFHLKVYNYINGEIEFFHEIEKFNPYSILKHIQKGANVVEYHLNSYDELDSIQIELHVISSDLAKFLTSQVNYETSKEDPFYPQPYPVFTNIKGGYGIFATHSFATAIAIKE